MGAVATILFPPLRIASFGTHLVRLVLAATLPLALLGLGHTLWNAEARRAETLRVLQRGAEAVRLDVEREFSGLIATLQDLAASSTTGAALESRSWDAGLSDFVADAEGVLGRRDSAISTIRLNASDGRPIAQTGVRGSNSGYPAGRSRASALTDDRELEREPLLQAVQSDGRYISSLVERDTTPRLVVRLAVPVLRDHDVSGTLVADVLPAYFGMVLRGQAFPESWTVTLMDARHRVIARSRDEDRFAGASVGPQLVAFQRGTAASALLETTSLDGSKVYTALQCILGSGWSIAVFVPRSALNAPVWRAVLIACGLGVCSIALAAAGAMLLGRHLGREIRQLGQTAVALVHFGQADSDAQNTAPSHVREIASVRAAIQQAMTALREADAERARLIATLDLAPVMIRDLDGKIQFWSQGCVELYGWTAEEAVGQLAHTLLHISYPGSRSECEASLRRDRMWTGTLQQRTKWGAALIVTAHKVLRYDLGGRTLVMESVADVTALQRAEENQRHSEARLRAAVDAMRLGIWEWDLERRSAIFDTRASEITGGALPPDQWIVQGSEAVHNWLTRIHPDDLAARQHAIDDLLAGRRENYEAMFRVQMAPGGWRWVHMHAIRTNPESSRLVGVIEDATNRQEAEAKLSVLVATRTAALADTEERFRAIFDAQCQLIWVLTPDGMLLEANQTALDGGGLTREEVIGRPFATSPWLHPEDQAWACEAIEQASQGVFVRREIALRDAEGHNIWVDFSLKPVRDQANARVRLIIPEGRDLTERRRLEAQLAQAQKTQALGQLAGGIAHDFNNILQSVSGAAAMLERRPRDHDRTTRLAKVIHDAAGRGASITQRLLSFARRGELRAELIDTDVLLANMREVLAHTLGSPVTVQAEVAPDTPSLMADRGQLETALVNLGTNARDAMPHGGTLYLIACLDVISERDRHCAGLRPGDYVRITVEDTGVGMDAAVLARVAEPFFTTKPEGRGTGLGLSMVKGFAEQSGGGLEIHSIPGQGTRITIWLPRAGDRAMPDQDDTPGPAVSAVVSQRVLLVDDDVLVRETIGEQLEELGFSVLATGSGAEALELLDHAEPIDAMVSDLSMPGMSGIEAIQEARRRRPDLHCFLLTGYMGERAALAGGDAFTLLRKPVSGEMLSAQIKAKLSQSRQLVDQSAEA